MVAINKHSSKLNDWSVEMPNAPYSKRWATLKTTKFMRSLIFIICIVLTGNLIAQNKNDFRLTTDSDTNFWYRYHMKNIDKLEYLKPQDSIDFFRISSSDYFLELSEDYNGTISFYVNEIWDYRGTGEYFIKSYELEKEQLEQIKRLIDSLKINSIPSDKFIEQWTNGGDGITYFIESKDSNEYSFKHYWTPSSQIDFPESVSIQFFINQIDGIVNYEEMKKLFENDIPFYGYGYKGSGTYTTITEDTKEYRKYKKRKERQLKRKK